MILAEFNLIFKYSIMTFTINYLLKTYMTWSLDIVDSNLTGKKDSCDPLI